MPYLLLILTTLFWSGNFVISRGMHNALPPVALSFWRWALACCILCLFGLRHLLVQRSLAQSHKRFLLTQALLGVAGFNTLIYWAMQSTTAINAALINSATPILIVIISWVRFGERLAWRQALGVLLSLSGVIFIISGGNITALLQLQVGYGDLLVVGAACLWATYSVNLKNYPPGLHPLAYQTAIAIIGLAALLPLYLLELASGKTFAVTISTIATIAYVAIFASVLAFIFWNKAVSALGANIAGPFIHLMPVFSTILAVLFLDETLGGVQLAAIFMIFSGIVLATRKTRRPS
jgi:drug/metabolite transporter (DMT)-like permease